MVSSTNKTDCHDVTEILLKVALITIKQTNKPPFMLFICPYQKTCMTDSTNNINFYRYNIYKKSTVYYKG
jgi:hypothetical protein